MIRFPRANERNQELGWIIDPKYLQAIQSSLYLQLDDLTLDEIEAVLLAVEEKENGGKNVPLSSFVAPSPAASIPA
jgi:hypothetical protein